MATSNPMTSSNSAAPDIKPEVFTIAGIRTSVYGLRNLPKDGCDVACIWLLHPRLQTQSCMAPIATQILHAWNQALDRRSDGQSGSRTRLIAASFDQRNHGSREVDKLANGAWREGNPRHAQDMFSIYHGTAQDTSLLITYLPSYIFPSRNYNISTNLCLGVSLGGHAAWHCVLHEPRITAAVIVIGCPDFVRLMTDRAAKTKLKTWTSTTQPGAHFLGSTDFPNSLLDGVKMWDPAYVLGSGEGNTQLATFETGAFSSRALQRLKGKWILNLAGGADKLVPYNTGKTFIDNVKTVARDNKDLVFEDVVFDGVGHQFTPEMAGKATSFICSYLSNSGIKAKQFSNL